MTTKDEKWLQPTENVETDKTLITSTVDKMYGEKQVFLSARQSRKVKRGH